MTHAELTGALSRHMPEKAAGRCAEMILEHGVAFIITRSRRSKLGDYRSPSRGRGHCITINHNLNPYMFLVTFIHEMAHLNTFNRHRHRVDPHGKEWKSAFRELLYPFLSDGIFPEGVQRALEVHLSNPSSSSCGDPVLYKALRGHDETSHYICLENLPEGCQFKMKGYSNVFIKGKLLRKTFHCKMMNSKREFRISAIAEVQQVSLF